MVLCRKLFYWTFPFFFLFLGGLLLPKPSLADYGYDRELPTISFTIWCSDGSVMDENSPLPHQCGGNSASITIFFRDFPQETQSGIQSVTHTITGDSINNGCFYTDYGLYQCQYERAVSSLSQNITISNLSATDRAGNVGTAPNFTFSFIYSISGHVYYATSYNDCAPAGGFNNRTVNLSGGASQTDTTDPNGVFQFTNLNAGSNYVVSPILPAGYTFAHCSTESRTINDLSESVEDVNFYLIHFPSISGNVYIDINQNCSTNLSPYSNGATVNLLGATGQSDTTDTNGAYSFVNLTFESNYDVALIIPNGFIISPCSTQVHTFDNLTASQTGVNFYIVPNYSISGTVFVDYDGDGNRDIGEPLYNGDVGLTISSGGSDNTNGTGSYSFPNLLSGNYTITLTIPTGYGSTTGSCNTPRTCYNTTTSPQITIGPNQTYDFGIIPLCNISGVVFVDNNHDSIDNTGDDRYNSGASTPLSIDDHSEISSVGTNEVGVYNFSNILPASYAVALTIPANYGSTTGDCSDPKTCKNPAKTRINVTVANNCQVTPTNHNFGITPLYTITASVYEDRSCPINYAHDAGEPGYQGATITLSDGSSGTTNSSGVYVFSDILSGNYNVDISAVSADYTILTTHPVSTAVGPTEPNPSVIFVIARGWAISGTLYNDIDDSGTYNTGDTPFTDGVQTITATHVQLTLANLSGSSSTSNGEYHITTAVNDDYRLSLPAPAGYKGVSELFAEPFSVCNVDVAEEKNFLIQGFTISGIVYIDHNHNGAFDAAYDGYYQGAGIVSLSGGYTSRSPASTNSSGYYIFHGLKGGASGYTVTLSLPTGYQMVSAQTVSNLVLGPDKTANFSITPLYTISGNVYKDVNKNHIKDAGESNYDPIMNAVTSTGGTVTYPTAGVYKVTNLISGSYTISYTPPEDYLAIHPKPPNYIVTVGKDSPLPIPPSGYSCNANPSSDPYNTATCYQDTVAPGTPFSGSIQDLNFGISNSAPWWQCVGGDCRIDDGINNPVPIDPPSPPIPNQDQCTRLAGIPGAMSNQHGVFYSGDNPYHFCLGSALGNTCTERASAHSWIAGGIDYPESFDPVNNRVIRTSYNYFMTTAQQNGITPTNLSTVSADCNDLNCILPVDLAGGVYLANGDLTLTGSGNPLTYIFPASRNIVILVNGYFYINTNLIVPIGSSVTFSAARDIHVASSVGVNYATSCDPTSPTHTAPLTYGGCNIEGFYSADGSFILDGNGETGCATGNIDNRLNIAGSVVVNANLTSGSIVNNRDLCENNLACPSYSITERPDLILNAPDFTKTPTYVWNEAAP